MDDDQVSSIVAEFVSITGIATDQARFFVDSAGGNLETALSTYYETIGTTNAGAPNVSHQPTTADTPVSNPSSAMQAHRGPTTLSGQAADEMPAEWKKPKSSSQNSSTRNQHRSGGIKTFGDLSGSNSVPSTSSRIRGISTLKDINSASALSGSGNMSEDEEDDHDHDGPADLYAGGSRSGINVQDPIQQQNPNAKAGGIVADILKKAKEAGSAPPPPSTNADARKAPPYFQGPAQTLGSDQVASRPIPPSAVAGPARRKAFRTAVPVPGHFGSDLDDDDDENDEEDEEVEKHLTFWKNGFSIEDGPLMSYDDPKNKEILDAINHGRAPLDLLGVRLNQRVTMRVQKRLTENYIPPPKPPAKPFEGTGHRLGSPLPGVITHSKEPSSSANPQTTTAPTLSQNSSAQPTIIFEVDNSLPTTSVQIRLSDGSRMVTRLNHTHTIRDIRRQIALSNPTLATRPYALQTTFPSRDLTDDNQSIKDAGILGAVVVQRYT